MRLFNRRPCWNSTEADVFPNIQLVKFDKNELHLKVGRETAEQSAVFYRRRNVKTGDEQSDGRKSASDSALC